MKKQLVFALFLCLSQVLKAQEITGDWGGALSVKGSELRLVFHIASSGEGYTATMDSPDQGVKDIPVTTTTFSDHRLNLQIPAAGIDYTGTLNADRTITGVFKQAGQTFDLTLSHAGAAKTALVRPQEPKAPFPYYTEDVVFQNTGANLQLAGTLTLPKQKGKFPVVILITGSGPQDRNESILGHQPFAVIADYLTRNGIGVLRFDDRGVGKSTGKFAGATTSDFATDVEAALAYLKTRKEVNKKRIGLIGHSEGGIIAPLVASRNQKDIAYIVLLAGTGIRGAELLLMQQALIARAEGMPEDEIEETGKINRGAFNIILDNQDRSVIDEKMKVYLREQLAAMPDSAKKDSDEAILEGLMKQVSSPWMIEFLRYDPAVALKLVKCPVLALNGSKDLQVPPKEDLDAIGAALKSGGNTHVTLVELDGLNHLFQECTTGSPSEYASIEQTVSPKALTVLTEWIQGQTK